MTMTSRFDQWLQLTAQRNGTMLALFSLAFAVVAVVWYARRFRIRLLWGALGAFWWSLLTLMIFNPPALLRPTFGLMLHRPLWYDEIFTWHMARLPLDRMLTATAGDVHPPGWYLIEHATIRLLGDSALALRIPALILSIIAVGLTYWLTRALGHRRATALGASGLLALMPAHVFYAQEARMYALLEASVLLATVGVVTRRGWLAAIGAVVALYAHNLAILYVAPLMLIMLLLHWDRCKGRLRIPWGPLSIGVVIAVLWAPWLAALVVQARDVGQGFWLQSCGLGGYLLPFYRLTLGMGMIDFLTQHGVLVAGGILGLTLWAGLRRQSRYWLPLAMVAAPTLALILVSELWRPLYLGRFFIGMLPFVCILLSVGLSKLETPQRTAILAALVPMMLLGLLWQRKGTEKYRELTREMRQYCHPGTVVYHANLASYIQLSYYFPEARHVVWPNAGDLTQSLTVPTQQAMGIERLHARELEADRLLVIWAHNPLTSMDELEAIEAALALGDAREVIQWQGNELVDAGVWEVRRD